MGVWSCSTWSRSTFTELGTNRTDWKCAKEVTCVVQNTEGASKFTALCEVTFRQIETLYHRDALSCLLMLSCNIRCHHIIEICCFALLYCTLKRFLLDVSLFFHLNLNKSSRLIEIIEQLLFLLNTHGKHAMSNPNQVIIRCSKIWKFMRLAEEAAKKTIVLQSTLCEATVTRYSNIQTREIYTKLPLQKYRNAVRLL